MTSRATVESWKEALDTIGVRHAPAPAFVPAGTAALLVLGYGARKGTVVLFETESTTQLGGRAIAQGYGFATAFAIEEPADLAEVLDEWGAMAGDEPPA